jgi:Subtilase family
MLYTCAFALLALSATTLAAQTSPPKPRITTEADLPHFRYPVSGSAQELLDSSLPEFMKLANTVLADIDHTLAEYQIEDHATLRRMLEARLDIFLIAGSRDKEALDIIRQIRAYEDKPAEKLTSHLDNEVYLRARIAGPATRPETCPDGYAALYHNELERFPWSTISPSVQGWRTINQVASPQFFAGIVDQRVSPTLAKQHALSLPEAGLVIRARTALQVNVPCSAPMRAVLDRYVAEHHVTKPDIWADREMVLPNGTQLTPVAVAIWDSGIDLSLFPDRLYTDPTPEANADPHGIAFDVHSLPTHGSLIPLTAEQQAKYAELVPQMEGAGDLESGVDTPSADALKTKLKSMSPAEVRSFFDNLEVAQSYSHGTHVTGIAARGNPAIRLAYARMTYDSGNPRQPPTEEHMRNVAASFAVDVAWFKAHGVRVVNMSWWDRPSNFEKDLADNGIGRDDAERKQLARRYFAMERDALLQALRSAPEILFVTIAGNNNANNAFEECIPSSFELPNLIVTGAVDQAGDETNFTSYGANVLVHADGLAVSSVVPGGATVKDSGTSMAAPQVTNLAAKLLAVSPRLTPEQLITLIRDGATMSGDGRRRLIDPGRSLQLLEKLGNSPVVAVE